MLTVLLYKRWFWRYLHLKYVNKCLEKAKAKLLPVVAWQVTFLEVASVYRCTWFAFFDAVFYFLSTMLFRVTFLSYVNTLNTVNFTFNSDNKFVLISQKPLSINKMVNTATLIGLLSIVTRNINFVNTVDTYFKFWTVTETRCEQKKAYKYNYLQFYFDQTERAVSMLLFLCCN